VAVVTVSLTELQQEFMRSANRLPTLFDLDAMSCAILALIEDAESSGREPTDDLEAQRTQIEAALATKLEAYCSVIRSLEHLADARATEADRLHARAKSARNAAAWLRQRLLAHLQSQSSERIDTPRFSVRVVTNPPRVEVTEEMLVPQEFKRTVVTTTIDKTAIMRAVRATGEIPPGVDVVRGQRVQIG
jgi:Siphovirus Gp157